MKKIYTLLFVTLFCFPIFAQSFWEDINGPQGLNIRYLQYSPQGASYVTDYDDRVFRSDDLSLSWKEIHGPVPGLEIRRLTIGFTGTLFCVGDDWFTLYRSTDLGETWSQVSNSYYSSVFTEAPDGGFLIDREGSILRTYDGAIWDTLYLNPNPWDWDAEFAELGWLPDGSLVAARGDCYSSFSDDFFLVSQDNGGTWDTLPGSGPISNLVALNNEDYIFSTPYCSFVYRSSIGSNSALAFPLNIINGAEDDFVVTPSGEIIVSNYYESRISYDGGDTWQTYDGSVYNSVSNQVLPGNLLLRGKTYSGNTMRSTNFGKTWKFSGYGLEDSWVYDLTFKDSDIAFGITSSGLWRTLDAGENWEIVPQDSTTTATSFSVYNIALAPNGAIFMLRPYLLQRSTDNGETFQDISPDSSLGKFARVAVQPQTGDLYLSGDSILVRSSDQGLSWQVLNTDMRFNYRPIVFHPDGTIYGIAYYPNGVGNNLVHSIDGGVSWQIVPIIPPYNLADNVQIAPDGKMVAIYSTGIFTSIDNGASWLKRSLPTQSVNAIKLNSAGIAYVGSIEDKRIFKTENDGATWTALPNIPSNFIKGTISLAFDDQQRLSVCTDGGGYFRSYETTVKVSLLGTQDYALEIFPNPASDGFWLKWGIEEGQDAVNLDLRDLCGRLVLQQTLKASPSYVVLPDLASGLYILELNKECKRIGIGKVFLK